MWRAVYALRLTQPDRGVPKILYVTPCDTDTEITFFESRPPWSRRVHFPFSARENLPSRILAITFTFVIDLRAIIDDPIPFYFPGFLSWRSVLKILNKRVVCKLELAMSRTRVLAGNNSSVIIFISGVEYDLFEKKLSEILPTRIILVEISYKPLLDRS